MFELDQKSNNLYQDNRRNNLEIQVIPANFTDDELEGKKIDLFSRLGIEVKCADCHRLGYANPKNTIVRFVNRKFCYQALDTKMDLLKLDSKRLGFNRVKTVHFSENLTPLMEYMECPGCDKNKENCK